MNANAVQIEIPDQWRALVDGECPETAFNMAWRIDATFKNRMETFPSLKEREMSCKMCGSLYHYMNTVSKRHSPWCTCSSLVYCNTWSWCTAVSVMDCLEALHRLFCIRSAIIALAIATLAARAQDRNLSSPASQSLGTLRIREYQTTPETIQAMCNRFWILRRILPHEPSLKKNTNREALKWESTGFCKWFAIWNGMRTSCLGSKGLMTMWVYSRIL